MNRPTVIVYAAVLVLGFIVLFYSSIEACAAPNGQPAGECLKLHTCNETPAGVFPLLAEFDKKGVGEFVKLLPPVAPQVNSHSEEKSGKAHKDTPKGLSDDAIYNLQLSGLTFVIGFVLAVLKG